MSEQLRNPLAPDRPSRARARRGERVRRWPPRLPDQPIFYPVLNEDYAIRIARDWNVKASGVGYVTRFDVRRELPRPVRGAAGRRRRRSSSTGCLPRSSTELNENIVGTIEVVHTHPVPG